MRILSLKMTVPKIAVLATGLTAAVMVATINPAPVAQASPDYASACTECHTAGGSVAATPSSATLAPGAAYTVALAFTGGSSPVGYWISGNGASVTASNAGPVSMTAPAAAGSYTYTVWMRSGVVASTTYSITVAPPVTTTTPPVTTTTPPVTTTTPPVTTTTPPVTTTTPPVTTTTPPVSGAIISSLSPTHGAVGSTVTISGTGFGTSGDANVQFGTAAAVQLADTTSTDNQIAVTVPMAEFMVRTDSEVTPPVWYQHDRTLMVTVTPTGGTASMGVSFTVDSGNGRSHGHGYGYGYGYGHGHGHGPGVRHPGDDG